jgi:hypothetical protein
MFAVDNLFALCYTLLMIDIKCTGATTVRLEHLIPLQGALKHRTQVDIDDLQKSLLENGLLQPFVRWENYIVDGHGRHTALMQLSVKYPELLEEEWPVIDVDAPDISTAKNALLEINSRYGKITPKGLEEFLKDVPAIKVPTALGVKVRSVLPAVPVQHKTHAIIKLRIDKDKVTEFTAIIKELSYVEIL